MNHSYSIYSFILGLHIISLVSWLSGLFYVVRLFVYHNNVIERTKTAATKEPTANLAAPHAYTPAEATVLRQQLEVMERRLLSFIASPALVLTFLTGLWLAMTSGAIREAWVHWKLMFVLALIVYHMYSVGIMLKLRYGNIVFGSLPMRFFNELAPILFVFIAFLVSYRHPAPAILSATSFIAVVLGVFVLIYLLRKLMAKKY